MTASSRPKPVEQPVMNQTGLEGASAMTASQSWNGGGEVFARRPPKAQPCRIDGPSLYSIHRKTSASMLQIRNRRVVELAAKLAAARRSTKTAAVLTALENELA